MGMEWVEARGAVNHPTRHTIPPPNVNRADPEEPCLTPETVCNLTQLYEVPTVKSLPSNSSAGRWMDSSAHRPQQ